MFLMFLIFLLTACVPAHTSKAQGYAQEWVSTYRAEWTITAGPNCENFDSDKNGRVRCNLTIEKDGQTENPPIECPSNWLPQFAGECQLSKGR